MDLPNATSPRRVLGKSAPTRCRPLAPAPTASLHQRCAQVSNHPRVDPDHAGFNPLDQTVGSVEVFGPDACGQSVGRGVRQTKGFRLIRERSEAGHRTEDFLLLERMILASPSRSSVQGTSHRDTDQEDHFGRPPPQSTVPGAASMACLTLR